MKSKITVIFLLVLIAVIMNGCISNSLGVSAPLPDDDSVMPDFTQTGTINDGKIVVNTADANLVPIPKVTAVKVSLVYAKSAIIEWETDIDSDGYAEYGTNELYGTVTHVESGLKTKHRVQLQELLPNTQYFFRIVASRYSLDTSKSYSANYTFTTEPLTASSIEK
ncbi:MAG: hypothetical protein BWY02_01542 [bacterium ADurb.Bin157]|jgi:phosphodiesterase/alkaline phosphatase D-like protein|nr:hypothetical protein [Candidatus Riflebacteria bacterium]OQB49315.1 MAG: hypothetical protein BWY02_01542 [bacterium ADurb.Bin157]